MVFIPVLILPSRNRKRKLISWMQSQKSRMGDSVQTFTLNQQTAISTFNAILVTQNIQKIYHLQSNLDVKENLLRDNRSQVPCSAFRLPLKHDTKQNKIENRILLIDKTDGSDPTRREEYWRVVQKHTYTSYAFFSR